MPKMLKIRVNIPVNMVLYNIADMELKLKYSKLKIIKWWINVRMAINERALINAILLKLKRR